MSFRDSRSTIELADRNPGEHGNEYPVFNQRDGRSTLERSGGEGRECSSQAAPHEIGSALSATDLNSILWIKLKVSTTGHRVGEAFQNVEVVATGL